MPRAIRGGVLLTVFAVAGCVPRAYAPAVYGSAAAGTVAAAGQWYAVEGWVRSQAHDLMGRPATRPETWGLHALATVGACIGSALLAWDKDACVPAALLTVLVFAVKEAHEWGHPGFSPLDGIMDFVAPATTAGLLLWWRGLPPWAER